jgi:hypothetical protein
MSLISMAFVTDGICGIHRSLLHNFGANKYFSGYSAGLPSQFCLSLFCLRQWWASKRIGPMQWFLNLLEELEIECQIRAAEPRTQKRYRRDTELILKLLVKKRFPAIWMHRKKACQQIKFWCFPR